MNQYIERSVFNPPDAVKMDKAIENIKMIKPELLVILLAYYAGLGGAEMLEVKVSDITEDFSFLIAPDKRKIPIASKLAEELKSLSWINGRPDTPVLLSRRQGGMISRMHANNITKKFMKYAGMPEVRLSDLRTACIVNWMQQYPWEYVSQISGLNLAVLTQRYQHYLPSDYIRPQVTHVKHTEITSEIINNIFKQHTNDLFGLIIRLAIEHKLSNPEICDLTWDMVDYETGVIHLQEKNIPISDELRSCLKVAETYSNAKWIIAFPNTHTQYDSFSISHLISKTLINDGYIGLTAIGLIRAAEYLEHKKIVSDLISSKGSFFVADFVNAAGISAGIAYSQLKKMEQEGLINQIGIRFYDGNKTVPPSRFIEIIKELDKENDGSFTSDDFAKRVGIDMRSAATQLRRLISEGSVERLNTRRYAYKAKQME